MGKSFGQDVRLVTAFDPKFLEKENYWTNVADFISGSSSTSRPVIPGLLSIYKKNIALKFGPSCDSDMKEFILTFKTGELFVWVWYKLSYNKLSG